MTSGGGWEFPLQSDTIRIVHTLLIRFILYNTSRLYSAYQVHTRVVESESLKVGKSVTVNIEKKSDKIGKIGFDFLLDFLAKMPKCQKNAIKCQNACTSGQGPASEYFF